MLLYAEDAASPFHKRVRPWWDKQLSGVQPVYLCWPVLMAFVRIGTNPKAFAKPLTLDQAIARVDSWFKQPCVQIVEPGERHWEILQRLLVQGQATGNLVSDAHIAALAIEHGCELCSTDADFSRFKGLRWRNPIGGEPV